MRDLVLKFKLYGDGLFYIPVGLWPRGETKVTLDNLKWIGLEKAYHLRTPRGPRRKRSDDE